VSDDARTWILVFRDLSYAVHVDDANTVFVALVLDADTGLAVGIGTGATAEAAWTVALTSALDAAEPPAQVVCAPGHGAELHREVERLMPPGGTRVVEAPIPAAAEDIFDELVGHLSGRGQPDDLPTDEDWALLVDASLRYDEAEPWQSWPDELLPRLVLTVDGEATSYIVTVIGAQGLQAGLVLYPGTDHSDVVVPADDWEPDDPLPFQPGTLLLHLNPADDTLPDMAAKALRLGWPEKSPRRPVWLLGGPDGFDDLDPTDAQHLTLACLAVLAHARKLSAPKAKPVATTSGTVRLAGGASGKYRLSPAR
jgi:hypothetical protein